MRLLLEKDNLLYQK